MLRTQASLWDELVSELPVGVVLQNARGVVLAANALAEELLGERFEARDPSGAPLPTCAELASQVRRTGSPLKIPIVLPHAQVWAEFHPIDAHGEARMLVLLRPVQADVPQSVGLLDALTGLPGRALLFDRLDQALLRARTHGTLTTLVLVDVHRLAAVNEEHGFAIGDELLTALAARLRDGLRADYTVARYGGDEFAVVAEHANGTGEAVADLVRELADRAVRVGGVRMRPGVRVCWATTDGETPVHALVAHAEERLRH